MSHSIISKVMWSNTEKIKTKHQAGWLQPHFPKDLPLSRSLLPTINTPTNYGIINIFLHFRNWLFSLSLWCIQIFSKTLFIFLELKKNYPYNGLIVLTNSNSKYSGSVCVFLFNYSPWCFQKIFMNYTWSWNKAKEVNIDDRWVSTPLKWGHPHTNWTSFVNTDLSNNLGQED